MAGRNNNNSNRRSNDSSGRKKKRSGCTTGIGKNGAKYTQGWKYSKEMGGIVKFFAATYKGTTVTTSNSGTSWMTVICTITKPMSAPSEPIPCLMEEKTGRVIIDRIGYVMNPKGGKGGYVGPFGGS